MAAHAGTHWTMSLFTKPFDFMTSVTFLDCLYNLSGLFWFGGSRFRGSTRVPGVPHDGGVPGGANPWMRTPFVI